MYQYRENNVQKLRENPNVSYVDKKVIEFSLSFRILLFEKWKKKPKELTIKEGLEENGILKGDVSDCIFRKNCASVPEERSAIPLQTEQSSAG